MPSATPTRSYVALAYADEVLEQPALLETAVRSFSANDDLTLVVYAQASGGRPDPRLEALARAAGLDAPEAPDVLLLSGEVALPDGVDWVLSARDRADVPVPVLEFSDRGLDDIRAVLRSFRCNVCGTVSLIPEEGFARETISCTTCGSTPRFRAIVHAVSVGLFGQTLELPLFPELPQVSAAGLSDWDGYARTLERCFTYENTYLHRPPFLDITDPHGSRTGTLDLLIASEVFEHVAPPVSRAFDGARRMLAPGGLFVLTVPYRTEGETVEHFPRLGTHTVTELAGERVLVNRAADGAYEAYGGLRFHGGDGATLEMRIFALPDILAALDAAGFVDARVLDTRCAHFGVDMGGPGGWPIIAYAPEKDGA